MGTSTIGDVFIIFSNSIYMLLIDLFTYVNYKFCRITLGKSKEGSVLSSLTFKAIYLSFFMLMLSCLIGFIYENQTSRYILNMGVSFVLIVWIISLIVFRVRYYHFYNIEQVKDEMSEMSEMKSRIYKYIVRFLYISTPILFFIFFRLYAFGYIL